MRRPALPCLLFFVALLAGKGALASPLDVTVMTQNLYVGTNTTALLQSTPANIAANIAAAENSVVANNFPARAGAIASEAASAGGPLLIGLQEAVVLSTPRGTLDYAQILLNQLARQGLDYTIAGEHTDLNVALNGFSATDREVVLARTGVPGFSVTGSQDYTFKHNVTLSTAFGPVVFDRGDVLVNASLDGQPFQFVSTHLDEFHTSAQPLQAGEIVSQLGAATVPQLVVGDFNATPGTATYQEMTSNGFVDTAAAVGAVGPTCCQAPDLSNPVSQLTNRYDYVFERDFSSIDSVFLVGNTTPFESMRPLWPSDHAGVVATVNVNVAEVPEPPAGMIFLTALFLLGILKLRVRGRV